MTSIAFRSPAAARYAATRRLVPFVQPAAVLPAIATTLAFAVSGCILLSSPALGVTEQSAGLFNPSLQAMLEDYRSLRPGSSYDASGREFHIGHLTLWFRSGTIHPILTASGKEAGFLFDGAGRYRYSDEDPADRQTIGKNILSFVNTVAYRDGELQENMKGCFFVSSSPLLPEILGDAPSGTAQSSPDEQATSRLSSLLRAVDDADIGIDHLAARSLLQRQPSKVVYGEIDGQTSDPGYLYDPALEREERLYLFRTVQGDRLAGIVSTQRAGAEWEHAPISVTRLDVTLDTENNRDAKAIIVESLAGDGSTGRLLPLWLMNHHDPAARDWTSKTRALEVLSVKGPDGRDLPFSHRYHELLVELPDVLAPGAPVEVRFELAYHFLNRKDGAQYYWFVGGSSGWLPAPFWDGSIKATCRWKVRTRKPYTAIAAGRVTARREEGDSSIFEGEMETPTPFPTLFIGKFDTAEAEKNGVRLRASVYARGKARAAEAYTQAASMLLDAYGKMLSPYPLKDMEIVEIEEVGWFMHSPAGMVLVSGQLLSSVLNKAEFKPPSLPFAEHETEPSPSRGDKRARESGLQDWNNKAFAHEFALQWWGNLVSPVSWRHDNWISVSVSEYLGAIVFSRAGQDQADQMHRMKDALSEWRDMADMSKDVASIRQAGALQGDLAQDYYHDILYGRGPLVLHMLRTMLGNDRFFALMRNIVTKHANGSIDTDLFAQEASAVAGQDMKWFFDQWIKEPGLPELDVSKSMVQEGGKTYIAGHLKQRDPAHFKRLLIPFVFDQPGGQRGARLFMMDEPEKDFRVELPAGVSSVQVDPANNNLAVYH